jgi:hypothetical protein
MNRAAMLAAQAEQVLADPAATINDKVRIDGAARRAMLDMQATLKAGKREPETSALDQYLAEREGTA